MPCSNTIARRRRAEDFAETRDQHSVFRMRGVGREGRKGGAGALRHQNKNPILRYGEKKIQNLPFTIKNRKGRRQPRISEIRKGGNCRQKATTLSGFRGCTPGGGNGADMHAGRRQSLGSTEIVTRSTPKLE